MKTVELRTIWVNQYGDTIIKIPGIPPGERDVYVSYKHNSTETSEEFTSLKEAKGWIYKFRLYSTIIWKELTVKTRI